MDLFNIFININFGKHLCVGFLLRIILILYGDYHDSYFSVPFTDVDYKVFTDAARHVYDGNSPYRRHTYRYSPLIAILLIPNVVICKNFGKFLFSIFDICLAAAIKLLVRQNVMDNMISAKISNVSALFWLYNPLSIVISTRGNADSFSCLFIIFSLFFLQTDTFISRFKYILCGVLLGLAIHLRLYPLVFSFPMYLSLSNKTITRKSTYLNCLIYFIPNFDQILLALGCMITLASITFCLYSLYGYEFLFETYIYHLFRKDTRHNFSFLFYYLYLNQSGYPLLKSFIQIIEVIVLIVLSLAFGTDRKTLNFAVFSQSVVLVTYNAVMTSQYFIWFLSILPLVLHDLNISVKRFVCLLLVWFCAQGGWLYFAYQLEFLGSEVFFEISLMSYCLFSVHIYMLASLIECYQPGHCFNLSKKVK